MTDREQELLAALKVAARWIENDGAQIGWSVDRLREVIAKAESAIASADASASRAEPLKALVAIQADPYGCRFCDSGKLRNTDKGHDDGCGFALMEAVLAGNTPKKRGGSDIRTLIKHVGCGSVDEVAGCVLCDQIRARLREPLASRAVSPDQPTKEPTAATCARCGSDKVRVIQELFGAGPREWCDTCQLPSTFTPPTVSPEQQAVIDEVKAGLRHRLNQSPSSLQYVVMPKDWCEAILAALSPQEPR